MTVLEQVRILIEKWLNGLETEEQMIEKRIQSIKSVADDGIRAEQILKLSELQLKKLKLQSLFNEIPKQKEEDTLYAYFRNLFSDGYFRQEQSKEAELLRIAAEKAKDRLFTFHQFCDGSYDQILLNEDSVFFNDESK
ncbi:hypothetical protein [Bythopirellula polymerisocia]|uniref:Uncharacterized protein n=1 Tax=Bythopirellula polymerisocia TaxID=2528003 RepID=A0A5C6C262_9BACT|nr:hypothetical protein [Bythopirellula polymerisocia]TWU17596.1 hypothetical protein Pla144_50980 [Bythopirellula polymerisocia]